MTILYIRGARVNNYKGATSLNVSKQAIINVNPDNDLGEKLQLLQSDSATFNLSEMSATTNAVEYAKEEIVCFLKRDLEKIEEKQEKLKIRKLILENQLRLYDVK